VLQSMTGFATVQGAAGDLGWQWDLRSVNAKGLDLRLRLPDRAEVIEPAVRQRLTARLNRGAVNAALKLEWPGPEVLAVDPAAVAAALAALQAIDRQARHLGLTLAPFSAADVLGLRNLAGAVVGERSLDAGQQAAILAGLDQALDGLTAMRGAEGAALHGILSDQVAKIADLTDAAETAAAARGSAARAALQAALARITAELATDEARLTQELALLAVKADVTEEIDRLRAHVAAARGHLADAGPVGRKLDFLAQEFNREANTLCSKAGSAELTQLGLGLKLTIDQMREQIQNVE
jgi:uncharacterized protein (TIGR00255 family)